ncbi:MAG TPA: alpha/beta hydrolase [Acidimicrobiia bacterium]|nr:alpha/beta hydrolase [Acidimicrobiia bacterium]
MMKRPWIRVGAVAGAAAAVFTVTLAAPAGAAPGDVTVKQDVVYRIVDGERLALDVYQPAKKGKDRPAVVVVHGGGWTQGDKALFAQQSNQLAQRGFVAFSVNYRLAPAHPYPAAVEDVEAAVAWVRKHAKQYGIDQKRIGALGGSAGGHLVGMLATDGEGSLQAGHRVAAVVSWSGPMDLVALGPAAGTNAGSSIRNFLGCLPDACPDAYAAASPVTHVDKTDSPMLIVNSANELVPKSQADAMKAALDTAGVANQEIILPGTAHSRAYSNQVWDQTVTFLENYLKK